MAVPSPSTPQSTWFREHYEDAAGQVVAFLAGGGVSLEGRAVADVGCGDGILDLGLVHRARPGRLVGFDVKPTDVALLERRAAREGVPGVPDSLRFERSEPTRLPASDGSFDVVVTWSAFEHVREPVAVLREVRRVLVPHGVLFLQLWPFWHSERGSHLWDWFPEGFHHLEQTDTEVAAGVRGRPAPGRDDAEYMLDEFRHLNRIDVDDLQRALLAAGLEVRRLELLTHTVTLRPELMRHPLSRLGIAGVKLLAVPS